MIAQQEEVTVDHDWVKDFLDPTKNRALHQIPDWTTNYAQEDKPQLTEEERERRRAEDLRKCGTRLFRLGSNGKREVTRRFCHRIHECDKCHAYYKRQAAKDLERAIEDLGNLWIYTEPIPLSEWRKVRYKLATADNTQLKSMPINSNSPQEGTRFSLFYLKVPTSDDCFFLAVACQDKPNTDQLYKTGGWQRINSRAEGWQWLLYTEKGNGRKSGRLSNYRKYFVPQEKRVSAKVAHFELLEDVPDKEMNRLFDIAVENTKGLQLVMELHEKGTEHFFEAWQRLLFERSKEWVYQLGMAGYAIDAHIRKISFPISEVVQLE